MFQKKEEVDFFKMFVKSSEYSIKAAMKLKELLENFNNVQDRLKEVSKIEHEGDEQFHEIYKELRDSFVPPLERNDILDIAQGIDNVTDSIEDVAKLFMMYDIKELRNDVVEFAELIVKICLALKDALLELKNFKRSKTLVEKIINVNTIEEEGDRYYEKTIKNLFQSKIKDIEIFKWHEIYKDLEECVDSCERVTNIVEDVILKNS